jgi:hypothetical protein
MLAAALLRLADGRGAGGPRDRHIGRPRARRRGAGECPFLSRATHTINVHDVLDGHVLSECARAKEIL